MDLSAQEVRDVRFGTTRMRAGYNMAEVDAFLDTVEAAIEGHAREVQSMGDESEALRSQVQQLQLRLAAAQAELDDARNASISTQSAHTRADESSGEQETVITPIESPSAQDVMSTAENPVVVLPDGMDDLIGVRDRVRQMLQEQLALVDALPIKDSPAP